MYEFLEKLKPTYCDNCNVDYCDSKKYHCEADLINAYLQGRADANKEFAIWFSESLKVDEFLREDTEK